MFVLLFISPFLISWFVVDIIQVVKNKILSLSLWALVSGPWNEFCYPTCKMFRERDGHTSYPTNNIWILSYPCHIHQYIDCPQHRRGFKIFKLNAYPVLKLII
jgi:hypothetical protein